MKKSRLINSNISSYISKLGHKDLTCIADCGLPIPDNCERIDISLERGVPDLFSVLDVINSDAIFESIIIAEEIKDNKVFINNLINIFGDIKIKFVSHNMLKNINNEKTRGIIRTGSNLPYHNVILVSGVKF